MHPIILDHFFGMQHSITAKILFVLRTITTTFTNLTLRMEWWALLRLLGLVVEEDFKIV